MFGLFHVMKFSQLRKSVLKLVASFPNKYRWSFFIFLTFKQKIGRKGKFHVFKVSEDEFFHTKENESVYKYNV